MKTLARHKFKRTASCRRGAMFLEFAFVIPILLVMVLGILEISTVFLLRHNMLNAARDAARSYSIKEVDAAGAAALATSRLPAIRGVNFTVTAAPDADTGIDRWVEVSVPFDDAAMGDTLGIFAPGNMVVRVTMRREE